MKTIAIVGGGIAGLSIAHALGKRGAKERGVEVVVLERAARPGGNIRTDVEDGYTLEWGPNGFLDSVPETLELVRDLGLQERLQVSDDRARRRFIFRRGRLHELPAGPGAFLASGLLSLPAKLRMALEPFARRRPEGVDETIHAFAARRVGREAADVLIDPMVSGVFGGDARRLSLRSCFPKMWRMETDHGGLFRALFALVRERRKARGPIGSPAGRLTSFKGGSQELIAALVARLGPSLRTGTGVSELRRTNGRFELELQGVAPMAADAVVLAGPASVSARIVTDLDAALAAALGEIPSAPMVVACLGYDEARLHRPLDGFGFLVPRGEGPRILGVLWDSSIYPGRAPAGRALIRVMLGGAHDPEAVTLDDSRLLETIRRDLRATMGLELDPVFARVFRHELGIPQYTVGHLDRLRRIEAAAQRQPGLHLAGNAYRGVAINNCVAEAGQLSERVLAGLPA
ncbi:MAG: protoporphyrinogen oxidase [Vicinamibacteria bacterium]